MTFCACAEVPNSGVVRNKGVKRLLANATAGGMQASWVLGPLRREMVRICIQEVRTQEVAQRTLRKRARMNTLPVIITLALISSAAAQTKPAPQAHSPDQLSSNLIELFDTHDLVALGEWHDSLEDKEIRIHLIHTPEFSKKVRNILVECGNSLYQHILDRYVDGEDVSREEIQKVWRDTTQSPATDETYLDTCGELIDEVRSINGSLPAAMRIRILAGDPPIDWAKVRTTEQFVPFLRTRDEFAAQLIEREILHNHQRALLVFGAGHIWRKNALNPTPNIASILDTDYPGKLFTVIRLSGLYPDTAKLESLISKPNRPVLTELKGTPVGKLDANEFVATGLPVKLFPEALGIAEVADACIYTGKTPDTRISLNTKPEDPSWRAEKERRRELRPAPRPW